MGNGIRDLDKAAWAALYKRVLAFARSRTDRAHAEEIAQEAFARVLTTRPWSEESGIPLFVHMTGIVRSLLSNERASKRASVEHTVADVDLAFTGVEHGPAQAPYTEGWNEGGAAGTEPRPLGSAGLPAGAVTLSPEEEHLSRATVLQRQQESSAAVAALVKRFSSSPMDLAVLGAWLDGITKPSAIAEHTKYEVDDVYVALRRIRRFAHSLELGAHSNEEWS
jgi:DNA-directed RNA polymerase specialized sigma24 family protein